MTLKSLIHQVEVLPENFQEELAQHFQLLLDEELEWENKLKNQPEKLNRLIQKAQNEISSGKVHSEKYGT